MTTRDSNNRRGGRPGKLVGSFNRQSPKSEVEIPVNLERALMRAAADPDYRELLLSDRAHALGDLKLTASERALLTAMPDHLLQRLVDRFERRRLKNRFAVGVAAAATGTMIFVASCGFGAPAGEMPDLPEEHETGGGTDCDAGPDGGE